MAGDPDRFRVSPSLTNLPMVVAPAVEDAGPRQLVEAGQAIQRGGAVASSLYEDVLKEQNQTRVTEALTKATEHRNNITHGEAGWASQLGKNALERPDGKSLDEEFGEDFDNAVANIELGLGNDAQKRMFRENASRMSLELRSRIQAHVSDQDRAYKLDTYAGMADTYSRQLALAQTDDERREARAGIESAANSVFAIKGTPDAAREEALRSLYTPGHLSQLTALLEADNIDAAEAYFNQYSGDLTAEAYGKVSGALTEQRALVNGENLGEQVWAQFQMGAAVAAPQDVLAPVAGKFVQTGSFGEDRGTHKHAGKDMAMPLNTPVRAGADGVARVKRDPKGYGLYVDLELDNGTTLRMAHLNAADVKDGERVRQGQVIARSGNSGRSSGPHLHYEVRVGGQATDPDAWHQGRPRTAGGGQTNGSLSDMLQSIDERDDWTVKEKARAKEIVKERWSARDADESRTKEQIRSRGFAEIDATGRVSSATRAAAVGAGLGDVIPSWRSFEKATQDRRAGKTVSDDDGLEAYGAALVSIADGNVDGLDHLLRIKPYVSDSQYKQLTDAYAKSPRDTQSRVSALVKELDIDAKYSGVFEGEDGKIDKKKYQRYIGAVESTIREREEITGKLVGKDERRQIVLGLLAERAVSGEGDRARLFDVRQLYDTIPLRARQGIMRGLRNGGVAKPQITDVVRAWRGMRKVDQDQYR